MPGGESCQWLPGWASRLPPALHPTSALHPDPGCSKGFLQKRSVGLGSPCSSWPGLTHLVLSHHRVWFSFLLDLPLSALGDLAFSFQSN